MNRIVLGICAVSAMGLLSAADSEGFRIWKSSDLQDYSRTLHSKMNKDKIGTEAFGKIGVANVQISHREADGIAEIHQQVDDWFVVEGGEATLQVGGDAVNKKVTGPGEVRGSSIAGGERKRLVPGDIVHITANVPHQLFVEPGKQFTYFVIKVPK